VVQVDCDHGARAQVLHVRARLAVGERPRGVEIPAVLARVEEDVVAHGAALGLCRHLLTAVGEDDRAREPVSATGTIGEVLEGLREAQLEPVLVGVPADRQVAEELTGLAVGADEEALGLPPLPPGGFAEAGSIEIVTGLRETGSSPADRDSPVFEASFNPASLVRRCWRRRRFS